MFVDGRIRITDGLLVQPIALYFASKNHTSRSSCKCYCLGTIYGQDQRYFVVVVVVQADAYRYCVTFPIVMLHTEAYMLKR